jgi:hypothetical protein
MSEFKNATNEEKLIHYLAGELSSEEKIEFELLIEKDSQLKLELKRYQSLTSLIEVDKKAISVSSGIGAERKEQLFGKQTTILSMKKESRILNVFKHLRFTIAAAALVLLSFLLLPDLWKSPDQVDTPKRISEVAGIHSFNMAFPSGTYHFTSQNGFLTINKIDSLDGIDFFKKSGVKAGDQILNINGIETEKYKPDEWRNLLKSLLEKPTVNLQVKRNGVMLPSNNVSQ